MLKPADVTVDTVARSLDAPDLPDPDLIIRTGDELRISNFLLWQSAYAELYFSPKLWPDWGGEDLQEALAEFQKLAREAPDDRAAMKAGEREKVRRIHVVVHDGRVAVVGGVVESQPHGPLKTE